MAVEEVIPIQLRYLNAVILEGWSGIWKAQGRVTHDAGGGLAVGVVIPNAPQSRVFRTDYIFIQTNQAVTANVTLDLGAPFGDNILDVFDFVDGSGGAIKLIPEMRNPIYWVSTNSNSRFWEVTADNVNSTVTDLHCMGLFYDIPGDTFQGSVPGVPIRAFPGFERRFQTL